MECCTGVGEKDPARLRECCRQDQAEVVSISRGKVHHTWGPPFSRALYMNICGSVMITCNLTNSPQHPGLRPAGRAGPGRGLVLPLPGEEGGGRGAILRHPAGLDALHVHVGQQVQGAPRIWLVLTYGRWIGWWVQVSSLRGGSIGFKREKVSQDIV